MACRLAGFRMTMCGVLADLNDVCIGEFNGVVNIFLSIRVDPREFKFDRVYGLVVGERLKNLRTCCAPLLGNHNWLMLTLAFCLAGRGIARRSHPIAES